MLGQDAVVILSLSAGVNLGVTFFSQIKYQFIDAQITAFGTFASDLRKSLNFLQESDNEYNKNNASKISDAFNTYYSTMNELRDAKEGRDVVVLVCNVLTMFGGLLAFAMFMYAAFQPAVNLPNWYFILSSLTNLPWLLVMIWNVSDYHILTTRCRQRKEVLWQHIQELPGVFSGQTKLQAGA